MDYIATKICVLVTAAFTLTLLPSFRRSERSLLSMRDRGTALLVFLLLGLVEEATASHTHWLNERIVAVCAAGLIAGPWVGLGVAVFVTWLALGFDGLPLNSIGISMLCGGVVAGLLQQWRPRLAQLPPTGFCLTWAVSWLRDGLTYFATPGARATLETSGTMGFSPLLQGLGTALILAIVAQAREQDEQARAAASAELRALQARMNPHFLFNALNALAGLSVVAPREIPRAIGRLRQFLRASFDQPERVLVSLEEELMLVRAYLDIESLRLGGRLNVELTIDPGLTDALIPFFSIQPLVENAVQQGVQSSSKAGRLRVAVHSVDRCLEMSVSDDGQGVPAGEIEEIFFAARPRMHALGLFRRRLQELYGTSFRLEVRSEIGQGTTVTVRIPLTPARRLAKSSCHTELGIGELAVAQMRVPKREAFWRSDSQSLLLTFASASVSVSASRMTEPRIRYSTENHACQGGSPSLRERGAFRFVATPKAFRAVCIAGHRWKQTNRAPAGTDH
jgi:two-component system, LytTR family, sensor kinase